MTTLIKTTHEGEYTTYSFTSRKVDYSVVTKDHKEFNVWSNRFGTANFPRGTLTVYWSMEELAARSKFFFNFAHGLKSLNELISATH